MPTIIVRELDRNACFAAVATQGPTEEKLNPRRQGPGRSRCEGREAMTSRKFTLMQPAFVGCTERVRTCKGMRVEQSNNVLALSQPLERRALYRCHRLDIGRSRLMRRGELFHFVPRIPVEDEQPRRRPLEFDVPAHAILQAAVECDPQT